MAVTEWGPPAELNGYTGAGRTPATPILTRRERVPAYQATGVTGAGEDVEPTIGQIWPR